MSQISPPPQVITSTNKAGLIVVITSFFLITIWLSLFVRLYCRVQINGPWKWDDWAVAIATLFSTIRSAVVYSEVHQGYGKSGELLESHAFVSIGKDILADNILYILTLFASKAAVLLLCRRISVNEKHTYVLWGVMVLSAVCGLASILLVTVKCNPGFALVDISLKCVHLVSRWKAVCAFDIITEIALFCVPMYLLVGLQMRFRLKTTVLFAFGFRLPVIVFAILRLVSIEKEVSSNNPTLWGAFTSAFTQVELDYSILACTMTCLGAFLKPFSKEMGPSRDESSGARGYAMNSLNSSNNTRKPIRLSSTDELPKLRNDATPNTATVQCPGRSSDARSLESNDSQKRIIMKQVQWSVSRNGTSSNANT